MKLVFSLLLPAFSVAFSSTTTTNSNPTFVDNFGDTWQVQSGAWGTSNTAATQVTTAYRRSTPSTNVAGTQVTNPSPTRPNGVTSTFLNANGDRWQIVPSADGTSNIANIQKLSNSGVTPTVLAADPVSSFRSSNTAPSVVTWGSSTAVGASNVAATQVNPTAISTPNNQSPSFVDAFGDTWQINSAAGGSRNTASAQVTTPLSTTTTYYTTTQSNPTVGASPSVAGTQLASPVTTSKARPGGASTTFVAANGASWQVRPSADGTSNIANAQLVPTQQQQAASTGPQFSTRLPKAAILIIDDPAPAQQQQQPGRGSIRGATIAGPMGTTNAQVTGANHIPYYAPTTSYTPRSRVQSYDALPGSPEAGEASSAAGMVSSSVAWAAGAALLLLIAL